MKFFSDCEGALYSLVVICCVMFSLNGHAESGALDERFAKHYQAWREECSNAMASSDMSALKSEHFVSLFNMGIEILPMVADRCIADTDFPWVTALWQALTKMDVNPDVNPWAKDSVKTWWEGGQELVESRFTTQYSEWKKANAQGRSQDAEKHRNAIRSMGILALGPMMEKLNTDDEVISMIADVIGIELGDTKTNKQAIRTWWTAMRQNYELPRKSESK